MGRSVGHGLGWLEFFDEMPEPRQKAKVLYPLPELLLCCLVGVLCGAEGWVEVEEYGEAKLDFLRRFLPFEHGIASHDTFSDVFNALDREGFKAAFIAWAAALQEDIREIVAIDGKTLRRSFDRGQGHGPIHMISAWATGQRLVLGQLAVGAKDNEITAIPELLALLSLKGAIVTIDAIGCQKKIADAIRQRGADYLLALKDNQPTLHRDVADFLIEQRAVGFKDCAAGSSATHQTTDADHGRIETRRHWITSDIAWLRQRHPAWPDLTSIAMIEADRQEPARRGRHEQQAPCGVDDTVAAGDPRRQVGHGQHEDDCGARPAHTRGERAAIELTHRVAAGVHGRSSGMRLTRPGPGLAARIEAASCSRAQITNGKPKRVR